MSAVALERSPSGFLDRIYELLDRVDFRRADSDAEREAIFRLRYEAYLGEHAILPAFERRFADEFDELGNTWLIGVHLDDRLVSSIRISVATKEFPDCPSYRAFPEFLNAHLDAGEVIVDPTRHVVARQAASAHPSLVYMTMRLGWMAAEYFKADILLAAVRTEHQAFYRRVGGHRVVCGARPYPGLIKQLSLMSLDYPTGRDRVLQRYPLFRSTFFERRMLFERLQETAAPLVAEEETTDLRIIGPRERVRFGG